MATTTSRPHARPTGEVSLPTFNGLDPVLSVSGIGHYFGVSKVLAHKWARTSPDFPEPFAMPPSGALYATADVIEWAKRHERKRAGGPREAGDPRAPSARGRRRARAA